MAHSSLKPRTSSSLNRESSIQDTLDCSTCVENEGQGFDGPYLPHNSPYARVYVESSSEDVTHSTHHGRLQYHCPRLDQSLKYPCRVLNRNEVPSFVTDVSDYTKQSRFDRNKPNRQFSSSSNRGHPFPDAIPVSCFSITTQNSQTLHDCPNSSASVSPSPLASPADLDREEADNKQPAVDYPSEKKKRKHCLCYCCLPYFSRKVCVIVSFAVIVVIVVAAWLLWPKVPSGSISELLINGAPEVNIESLPYHYYQDLTLRIHMKNYNVFPLHLKKIVVRGRDHYENVELGSGVGRNIYLAGNGERFILVPYQLRYQFTNVTDRTWTRLTHACVPEKLQLTSKNTTPLRFIVSLDIPEITWISKAPQVTYQADYYCK